MSDMVKIGPSDEMIEDLDYLFDALKTAAVAYDTLLATPASAPDLDLTKWQIKAFLGIKVSQGAITPSELPKLVEEFIKDATTCPPLFPRINTKKEPVNAASS